MPWMEAAVFFCLKVPMNLRQEGVKLKILYYDYVDDNTAKAITQCTGVLRESIFRVAH